MMNIFTFWEPKESVHGYLKLCMRTWTGRFPDSRIVVLDYDNLGEWLDPEEREAVLCREMPLAMQADCIRCAVLYKHGGMWLDADTIVTSRIDSRFTAQEVVMVGHRGESGMGLHGAFVYASVPHAGFLTTWYGRLVPRRVATYRKFERSVLRKLLLRGRWKEVRAADYCLNAIINPMADDLHEGGGLTVLERNEMLTMPEDLIRSEFPTLTNNRLYRQYWFSPGEVDEALARNQGLIMLHNSWTRPEFRRMEEAEFLRQDIRLAKLLRILSV